MLEAFEAGLACSVVAFPVLSDNFLAGVGFLLVARHFTLKGGIFLAVLPAVGATEVRYRVKTRGRGRGDDVVHDN